MIAIETKNLRKEYKDKVAVNSLNLSINEGELFSLLGTNGAGKTTTIKMITSLIKSTSGEIFIKGKKLESNKNEIRKIMNVSPQETAIAPNLTVLENLKFMAGVYQIKNPDKKIKELIETFNLKDILNKRSKNLSGGWQRRLSIAIALINDPEILFLDEPTLGLDVLARRELWKVVGSLKRKITIILTTHYMEEAEMLSDRIGIMVDGNLVDVGTSQELIKKTGSKNFEDAFVSIATGGNE